MNRSLIAACTLLIFSNCQKSSPNFMVGEFSAIENFAQDDSSVISLNLDYSNSITEGFVVPSAAQSEDANFHASFRIKNLSESNRKFFYKIYYQNRSYKWPETKTEMFQIVEHPLCHENFYGSWANTNILFQSTDLIPNDNNFHEVEFKFKIVGNPRDEKKYYSNDLISPDEYKLLVKQYIDGIILNKEWLESVRSKADQNDISLEKQLELEAEYLIRTEERTKKNQRWQRNPRVGDYEFMLVVCDSAALSDTLLPHHIQNISSKYNGRFINPFYHFSQTEVIANNHISVSRSDQILRLTAKPKLGAGIYVDNHINSSFDNSSQTKQCGNSEKLFREASVSQFLHFDLNKYMNNVNSVLDVQSEYFSQAIYDSLAKIPASERVQLPIASTDCPCETVISDSSNGTVTMFNPGGDLRKENVGILTRHGFTYGKFRAKVDMPELINEQNIWNGLTNAIWMINQSNEKWNARRVCSDQGYIERGTYDPYAKRDSITSYSEIDFEIVKTSEHWPRTSYSGKSIIPEIQDQKGMIAVTCSNHDLACRDARDFNVGAKDLFYKGAKYVVHRWTHWYQAITSKYLASNKELFASDHYYFEIDWKPESITWRIGPDPDNMKVIAVMDESVTNIPNNQMLMVFTQEYHLSDWWPTAPYLQENIPAPARDISGRILEITIE